MAYLAIQILTVYLNYSSAFRFALDVKPFPSFRVSSNREDVIVGKYYNALGRSVGRSHVYDSVGGLRGEASIL